MDSFEWNKIFAAVLIAGITASFAGFLADRIVHPEEVTAHGPEAEGAGATVAAAPEGPEPVLAMLAAADPAKGQKLFRACAACHTVEQGGPNGVGPNLWNVLNRGVSQTDGYSYSGSLVEAAGESWEYIEMNKFLYKPKTFAPGTKMNFIGLKKPADRAAVIAYLHSLSDSPAALPTEAEIAAEEAELAPPEEATEGEATEAEADVEGLVEEAPETEIAEEPADLKTTVPPAIHQEN